VTGIEAFKAILVPAKIQSRAMAAHRIIPSFRPLKHLRIGHK
jgi:hypothetical protein